MVFRVLRVFRVFRVIVFRVTETFRVLLFSGLSTLCSVKVTMKVNFLDEEKSVQNPKPQFLNLGYCPHPARVYIRGPIKGYI